MSRNTSLLARIFYLKSTGSKLPWRLRQELPIDLRLWLSGAVDVGEMFWLAEQVRDS